MVCCARNLSGAQPVPAGQNYPVGNYTPHDPRQPMPNRTSQCWGSGAEVVCWRCSIPGHVTSGCRMPLNGTAPVSRD